MTYLSFVVNANILADVMTLPQLSKKNQYIHLLPSADHITITSNSDAPSVCIKTLPSGLMTDYHYEKAGEMPTTSGIISDAEASELDAISFRVDGIINLLRKIQGLVRIEVDDPNGDEPNIWVSDMIMDRVETFFGRFRLLDLGVKSKRKKARFLRRMKGNVAIPAHMIGTNSYYLFQIRNEGDFNPIFDGTHGEVQISMIKKEDYYELKTSIGSADETIDSFYKYDLLETNNKDVLWGETQQDHATTSLSTIVSPNSLREAMRHHLNMPYYIMFLENPRFVRPIVVLHSIRYYGKENAVFTTTTPYVKVKIRD